MRPAPDTLIQQPFQEKQEFHKLIEAKVHITWHRLIARLPIPIAVGSSDLVNVEFVNGRMTLLAEGTNT